MAVSLVAHCTTTEPVILGWMEQKYGYVPALLKVKENFSSVSSTLDWNTLSVLTMVWGMSSRLVQVTVVPTATVSVAGPKLKLSTFTSALAGCGVFAELPGEAANSSSAAIITIANRLAMHTLFLIMILFLFSFRDSVRIDVVVPDFLRFTQASNRPPPERCGPARNSRPYFPKHSSAAR